MSVFALLDCNNFFVSCERVFNPSLQGKPVVVLSNNDGCVISRSNEAKLLGIPMGVPYFKCKEIFHEHNVRVLSSNYELYGDMSRRVMALARESVEETEVYSIDEAFLDLSKLPKEDIREFTESLKYKISKGTGIPISVGVGLTKTLAKSANYLAKKSASGIFDIRNPETCNDILGNLGVEEVWGIGRNMSASLKALDINTARELRDADPKYIRKLFGVMGEKIVFELRGKSCFELNESLTSKKNIVCSRSFGRSVTLLSELEEATADYAARACRKMRAQKCKARGVCVFVQTSKFKEEFKETRGKNPSYRSSNCCFFEDPTSDTTLVIKHAKNLLQSLFKAGAEYKKAGVYLLDLKDSDKIQESLFHLQGDKKQNIIKKASLMQTMDNINTLMGKDTIFIAAQGIEKPWIMNSSYKSPGYTTNWGEIPKI